MGLWNLGVDSTLINPNFSASFQISQLQTANASIIWCEMKLTLLEADIAASFQSHELGRVIIVKSSM